MHLLWLAIGCGASAPAVKGADDEGDDVVILEGDDDDDDDETTSGLPPVAVFSAPEEAWVGDNFRLDAAGSYDPNGASLDSYDWACSDGTVGVGINWSHTLTEEGTLECSLVVHSETGLTATLSSETTVKVRGFEADQGTEPLGMARRQIEHQPAADRATHDHGPLETERVADIEHHLRVGGSRELVCLALEAFGRQRLAVPGHVEHDDAKVLRDGIVVEDVAKLAAIGASRVQADQRDAAPRLLDVKPVRAPGERQIEIATDDGLEVGRHRLSPFGSVRSFSSLGAAMTSFTY